jgi:hypothetical protein
MKVRVLRPFEDAAGVHRAEDIIEVADKVVGSWIEAGWAAPIENKLMPAPADNKASGVAEQGEEATEPSGAVKPVRRKIKHRKKAVAK